MRKNRILCWAICFVLALGLLGGEILFKEITKEKTPIHVYAPKDMESAFKIALKCADMKSDYKIVITKDISEANIIVEMGKEFDPEYTKIAYSPFVIVYSSKDRNIKYMREQGLLQDALFDNRYKEINFNMVIDEVIEEGKWENFGVKDMGTIKVYYPSPETSYYTDYYDFMLVTVNGGTYPNSESDLEKAMEKIERFENSEYTEAVLNYEEKVERTGGFMENTLYLMPEIVGKNLYKSGRLFYPTTTVYVNYYIKADELGSRLVEVFDDPTTFSGNFYDHIEDYGYRNDWDGVLNGISDYMYDERDVYNVLHLDQDRIRPKEQNLVPDLN